MRCLACCALLLVSLASQAHAADMLNKIGKHADKAANLLQERGTAPESSWNPLAATQKSYDSEIRALLDKILATLCDDSILETKNAINRLKEENAKSEKLISELTLKKIEAPTGKNWYDIHKTTRTEIDERIASEKKANEDRIKYIDGLKNTIKSKLRNEVSLKNISDKQLDSLFSTVMGESSLELIVVLKNIISLIDILKNNLIDSGENIHIAKKYYSIYYFMTAGYVRQHDIVLERNDTVYEPTLHAIIDENKILMEQTRKLLSQDAQYKTNYQAQQITDRTAQLYARYLRHQRHEVEKSRAKAMKTATLAENTYLTVNIAHRLGQVMQEGQRDYEQLLSLQVPELILFENKEMEQEFVKLTERLQVAVKK